MLFFVVMFICLGIARAHSEVIPTPPFTPQASSTDPLNDDSNRPKIRVSRRSGIVAGPLMHDYIPDDHDPSKCKFL